MKLNIKDSVLIAILPFYGYLAAFNFEQGYLSAFGLVDLLVQVQIESIITFTTYLILFIFILVGLLDFIFQFYAQPKKHPIIYGLIKVSWIFLIAVFLGYMSQDKRQLFFALGMLIVFVLLYFSIPLFKFREDKKNNYIERLKLFNDEVTRRGALPKDDNSILRYVPRSWAFILLTAFIVCLGGQTLGKYQGMKTETFAKFVYGNKEYVLIRNYRDTFIAIELNQSKLTNRYLYLKNFDSATFEQVKVIR